MVLTLAAAVISILTSGHSSKLPRRRANSTKFSVANHLPENQDRTQLTTLGRLYSLTRSNDLSNLRRHR